MVFCLETPVAANNRFNIVAKLFGFRWTETMIQDFGGLLRKPVQFVPTYNEDTQITERFAKLVV